MTSGGPCHLLSRAYFLKQPTNNPTREGIRITNNRNSSVLLNNPKNPLKLFSGFRKMFVKNLTRLMKPKTLIEVTTPIKEPITNVVMIEKNIFNP
tara:strand:+ start:161 stop:445 length:285 start_codon:yes stop_codon:yes gene_type:complete